MEAQSRLATDDAESRRGFGTFPMPPSHSGLSDHGATPGSRQVHCYAALDPRTTLTGGGVSGQSGKNLKNEHRRPMLVARISVPLD